MIWPNFGTLHEQVCGIDDELFSSKRSLDKPDVIMCWKEEKEKEKEKRGFSKGKTIGKMWCRNGILTFYLLA